MPPPVVVSASLFHAYRFGHGNLNVIDVAPVPDRLEDSVCEPECQNILYGFFSEVMIDPVNLAFIHHFEKLLV